MTKNLTMRQIEQSLGFYKDVEELTTGLEVWYASVIDKPVADFDIRDLCIACRQEIYPEYVVPFALTALSHDPVAGHKYDGELLVALKSVPREHWKEHPEQAEQAKAIANRILKEDFDADDDLEPDARKLIARIQAALLDQDFEPDNDVHPDAQELIARIRAFLKNES